MLLEVASLLESQESVARIPFREMIDLSQDVGVLLNPVEGEITIERAIDGSMLTVKGEISTRIEVACDRCGKPFAMDLKVPVEECLRVESAPLTSLEVEESVEATGKLDLSDLLRQVLILNLPIRKLCGCPALSEGEKPRVDIRWQSLEALKKHATEEEE